MASQNVEKLVSEDAAVRTPITGVSLLLRQLADDDIGLRELVAAIERFPSITARLLTVANSAWSAPSAPITTLPLACRHLGLRVIQSISISLVVSAPFNVVRCPAFDPVRFWYGSLLVAEVAERLATECRNGTDVEPQALRTAGLLHNLGLLWLADKLPDDVTRALQLAESDHALGVNQALRLLIGTDSCEVGGLLLRKWQLPEVLAIAVEHHRDAAYTGGRSQWAALLGGAADMASALRHQRECPATLPDLDRVGIVLDTREEAFAAMRGRSDEIRALAGTLG